MEKEKDNNLFLNKIFYIIVGIIILIGIYIRTKTFIDDIPFNFDECLLGNDIIQRDVWGIFKSIGNFTKIPPLWGIIQKIIINSFGCSFKTFRIFSYCSSILSIFAFAFLLKNIYKNKSAVILGLILFILNTPLIYFATNFRPYESDVLICILLLISYKYVSFKEITPPHCILYTLISILTILFSFPSIFIIPAIILAKSIEEKKFNYKSLIILSGVLISCLYLYLIDKHTYQYMNIYWQTVEYGFIKLSINSFINIFQDFFNYIFTNYNLLWLIEILIFIGFIRFYIQRKNERNLLLFILLFAICASLLKIYPFARRHILWCIPIVIIYFAEIIDDKNKNLIKNILITITIIFLMNISITKGSLFYNIETYDRYMMYKYNIRVKVNKNIKKLLSKYKEDELILAAPEMNTIVSFYNKIYCHNKNLKIIRLPDTDNMNKFKNFIEEIINIKPKPEAVYIVNRHTSYTFVQNVNYIENILKELNYKYEKQSDDCMYIFKVYNKT